MLGPLLRAHDRLTELSSALGKACLAIIFVAYCYEVAARYFFNAPTWWADEAVSYSLCIGCFLMMPCVTRDRGHVAVTFLVDLLPHPRVEHARWAIHLVCFVVCALAFWISLDENLRQIAKDVHLMKVKPIPKYWISVFITYGFGMSALHFLRMLARGAGGGAREGRT